MRRLVFVVVIAGLLFGRPGAPRAEPVALELVLAVDVSSSISRREYNLQMRGLAQAFRSEEVVTAVAAYAPQGIAVSLFQWGGRHEQTQVVEWQLVRDATSAEVMAARVDVVLRIGEQGGTALGDAIFRSSQLFDDNGFEGARLIIDVSGDGRANLGMAPSRARDAVAERGITINGLAILNEEPRLAEYYRANVIGGIGAFLMTADDYKDFALAIRTKLIREIGGAQLVQILPDGTSPPTALARGN